MTEGDRIEAGELALGVLEGEERAAALRRLLAEPGFAAEVTRWRRHLEELIDGYPEVAPPDAVERAVAARLRRGGSVTPEPGLGVWRGVAVAASAVAASLALILAWPRPPARVVPPPPSPHILVAALAGEGKPFPAVYDGRATVSVVGAAPWPADRSAELWLIGQGKPPRPLGLLARGERGAVAVPGAVRQAMAAGATLAVSIEPAGGSPTGLPTGPVVASGGLVAG